MLDTTPSVGALTDAEVKAALTKAQFEAHQLYQLALAAPAAPTNTLKASWQPASMATPSPALMLPARQLRGLYEQALAAAQAAVCFYSDFLAEHAARSPAERERTWMRDREALARAANPVGPMPSAPAFSARAFLADLARRGIGVFGQEDKLVVTGTDKLTANDRRLLAEHKAELLAQLAASQEVF